MINKETQKSVSTILDKNVVAKIEALAKKNKRSVSAQIAFIIEESFKAE